VSVDFSANPDKVMTLLKDVAMSVRTDPKYSALYLADPTLLGVDSIKGSQVIYPVQLKTKANQQWAPMRETQRRIRLALEEHGMLPGDPLRVFSKGSVQRSADSVQQGGGASAAAEEAEAAAAAKPDPTAAKPNEVNPFTGEGM
jgi:moderate conductance mechanosensitive channel